MNFTSFGESVNAGGFIQKTVKGDLFVKANHIYPRWHQLRKTLEGHPSKQSMRQ
jgi:hypothetical protein